MCFEPDPTSCEWFTLHHLLFTTCSTLHYLFHSSAVASLLQSRGHLEMEEVDQQFYSLVFIQHEEKCISELPGYSQNSRLCFPRLIVLKKVNPVLKYLYWKAWTVTWCPWKTHTSSLGWHFPMLFSLFPKRDIKMERFPSVLLPCLGQVCSPDCWCGNRWSCTFQKVIKSFVYSSQMAATPYQSSGKLAEEPWDPCAPT